MEYLRFFSNDSRFTLYSLSLLRRQSRNISLTNFNSFTLQLQQTDSIRSLKSSCPSGKKLVWFSLESWCFLPSLLCWSTVVYMTYFYLKHEGQEIVCFPKFQVKKVIVFSAVSSSGLAHQHNVYWSGFRSPNVFCFAVAVQRLGNGMSMKNFRHLPSENCCRNQLPRRHCEQGLGRQRHFSVHQFLFPLQT